MDNEKKEPVLSDADIALIMRAANSLSMDALILTENNSTFAIGALSLALAGAAIFSKVPIDILLNLVTMHFINQTMLEAKLLLENEELNDDLTPVVPMPINKKDLN
jgi:hypothetical protein